MNGFRDVQRTLDRILGTGRPNHGAFWQSVTRDQFIQQSVYGMRVVVPGDPNSSNLVKSLRGLPPFGADLNPRPPGAFFPRMPAGGRPPAEEKDIVIIEDWIRSGCPEYSTRLTLSSSALTAAVESPAIITDQTHVEYWRAVDDFFLPGLSSEETALHVGRMHAAAFQLWAAWALEGQPPSVWSDYLSQPQVQDSFEYVRTHQRRLIIEFYEGSQEALFDSLWKFGANRLPTDPHSHARPEHTMNGVRDWFFWVPHLEATLRATDLSQIDLALARAWQVGIVADGLLRTDADRPESERMPIRDFSAHDPALQANVFNTFSSSIADELQAGMLRRAEEYFRR